MLHLSTFAQNLLNGLDFILGGVLLVFTLWVIISAWKAVEETLGEEKALLMLALLSVLVVIISYL